MGNACLERGRPRDEELRKALELKREEELRRASEHRRAQEELRNNELRQAALLQRLEEERRQRGEEAREGLLLAQRQRKEVLARKFLLTPNSSQDFSPLKTLLSVSRSGPHHTACSVCSTPQIYGIRLACAECADFNSCLQCFQSGKAGHSFHVLVLVTLALNHLGEARLNELRAGFIAEDEELPKLTWESTCEQCGAVKQSFFLVDMESGGQTCRLCFKQSERKEGKLALDFLPIEFNFEMAGIKVEDAPVCEFGNFTMTRALCIENNVEFFLTEVRYSVFDQEQYLRLRNRLVRCRGSRQLTVFGYCESTALDGSRIAIFLHEYVPNLNLMSLLRSSGLKVISLRRKIGLLKSLALALQQVHKLGVVYSHVCPELIFLDRYHEVKLLLYPFGNQFAHVELKTRCALKSHDQADRTQYSDIFALGLVVNWLITGVEHSFDQGRKLRFKERGVVLQEVVQACMEEHKAQAGRVAEHLQSLQTFFWKQVQGRMGRRRYELLSAGQKNLLFESAYQDFRQLYQLI